ncbi:MULTISPECIES: hypothetical protein [unclassified Microbacterium]|uniref:hypothetical protein n=1 Tax=unclassified Microbacterium TaxID=2609290 RepID=UPI00365ABDAB
MQIRHGVLSRVLGVVLAVAAVALTGCAPAAADACVSGRLEYTAPVAEDGGTERTVPARSSTVQVWAASSSDGRRALVHEAGLDDDGRFEVCARNRSLVDVELRFLAQHEGLWRVVSEGEEVVARFTAEDVGTTVAAGQHHDIGTIAVPDDEAGAWRIVDAVTDLYDARATESPCWAAQSRTDCAEATYVWPASDPENAGFWDHATDRIVLGRDDANSRHLILHETGHWWQNQLYADDFPDVVNCDTHYIDTPSSPSCGWTEGFADAVAAQVLGDRVYVSDSGEVSPFEESVGTAWAGGDSTQGNVAATLLDLWALQEKGEGWASSIAFMTGHPSADLGAYIADRYPQRPATVSDILRRHGIDLG